ncbi:MAG TPA: hypothetical protein VGE31_02750 [Candidatus Paceibacterota bacterium]
MHFESSTKIFLSFSFGLFSSVILCAKYLFEISPSITLDVLQFSSILLAIFTFLYTRKKDEYAEVTNQLSFYREKVIPREDKFLSGIDKHGEKRVYLDFDTDKFDEICKNENLFNIFKKQYAISQKQSIDGTRSISSDEIDVLNLIEEFSVKVLQFNTQNHPALYAIHSIFVIAVEMHASRIFYVREIEHGKPLYAHLLKLYFLWKQKVDRRTVVDRLKQNKHWIEIVRPYIK